MEAGSYEARLSCFLKFTIISDVNLLYVYNQKALPASRVSTLFRQAVAEERRCPSAHFLPLIY